MHLVRRSLAFLLAAAIALATPLAALEAQTLSGPLALICEAAQQEPVQLRIDYDNVNVNGVAAKFTHDQISWQATASNGATEDFKYDRNSGLLTGEIKSPPAAAPAPASRPVYHCRRAG